MLNLVTGLGSMQLATACSGCGKEAEGLKRCAACFQTAYCSKECQASHWPKHKTDCKKIKLFDVYKGSPLLALSNFASHQRIFNPALFGKVNRKEQQGIELHLYMSDLREPSAKPHAVFDSTGGRYSGEVLKNMVIFDGPVAPMVVGTLVGFHVAINRFNQQHAGRKQILLVRDGTVLTNYSICIGHHNADHELVYHYDGQTRKFADKHKHCWMLFGSEGRGEVVVDACALPYGFQLRTNITPYSPKEGDASEMLQLLAASGRPDVWAPLFVVDRKGVRAIEQTHFPNSDSFFDKLNREDRRVVVSGRPIDDVDALLFGVLAEVLQVDVAAITSEQTRYLFNWFEDSSQVMLHALEEGAFLKYPAVVEQGLPPGFAN